MVSKFLFSIPTSRRLRHNILEYNTCFDLNKTVLFLKGFHSSKYNFIEKQSNKGRVTVDEDEVKKFGAMSEQWWDPHGSFKLLHQMNPPRVQYILDNLSISQLKLNENIDDLKGFNPLKGLKILDVGCGGGLLSESLARLGAKVTGIDASSQNISIANLHKAKDPLLNDTEDRLNYRCITSHDLLEEKGEAYYDHICSFEVIEHVNNPLDFTHSLTSLLKPHGSLFLSTINRNALSYFLTILMAEHLLKLTPIGTHDYVKYITPEELAGFIRKCKLDLNNLTSISYSPFHNEWLVGPRIFPSQPSNTLFELIQNYLPVNYLAMATKN